MKCLTLVFYRHRFTLAGSVVRAGGISVLYSLVFELTSDSSEVVSVTSPDPGLRDMVTKALREEASLPVDLDSLNFDPGTVKNMFFQVNFPVLM